MSSAEGFRLLDGGYVTTPSEGLVAAPLAGIEIDGTAATVSNAGTIEEAESSGAGIALLSSTGTVSNSGVISASGEGILLQHDGAISNFGTISAGAAILLNGNAGTVTNYGAKVSSCRSARVSAV